MFDSLVIATISKSLVGSKLDVLVYIDLFLQKLVVKFHQNDVDVKRAASSIVSTLSSLGQGTK
jgi:hypothetical protein